MKPAVLRYHANRRTGLLLAISSLAIAIIDHPLALAKEISFATLTSSQLAAMLEKKDFFFVNVHTPYEGEIKNTDAFIAFDKVADNLDKLPKDRTARNCLYAAALYSIFAVISLVCYSQAPPPKVPEVRRVPEEYEQHEQDEADEGTRLL